MILRIEHKGYVVFQADNNHVTLSKNGKRIAHAQCTEKHTEESLHQYADNFLDLLSKLGADLTNEEPTSTVVLPKVVVDPKVVNQLYPQPAPARSLSRKEVKKLRQYYPIGTRLFLVRMNDPYAPVSSGTRGTIEHIDDAGQFHMNWDNGRTLALVPYVDQFRKLTAAEAQAEVELADFCRYTFSDNLMLPGDYDTFHISEKDEFLTVRLDKSPSGKLSFHVSFTPDGGHAEGQEVHTEDAAHNDETLLRACRRVLSLYHR